MAKLHEVPASEVLVDSDRAGELLGGVSGRRVRKLARGGYLPALLLPGSRTLRFRPESLRRFAEENEMRELPKAS